VITELLDRERFLMTDAGVSHIDGLVSALGTLDGDRVARWGHELAGVLAAGGRLLVAGNGGSAAQAAHLSAELVGRFGADRRALSALALHADTSTLTAVGNDYGFEEVFARQVAAHGRPGDVLMVLSTSGRSRNLLAAVHAARALGLHTWALTGPTPNRLAGACDDHLAVSAGPANVQECHLVAVHLLCAAVDEALTPSGCPLAAALTPATAAAHPPAAAVVDHRQGADRRALVVVGDLLVDETLTGEVERIAPEAPVPVIQSPRRTTRPGGAGLAALLAARDGHAVTLITAHNHDEAAAMAAAVLSAANVTVINLGTTAPTPIKTRLRGGDQLLLMLDRADPARAPGVMPDAARAALEGAGAVLVADYGRGLAAGEDVRVLLSDLARRVPVVWDPHPRGPAPVRGVTVATPNSREAAHFTGDASRTGLRGDVEHARELRDRWGVGHVVVTRGRDGAVMVSDDDAPPLVVPAPSIASGDACGAGDRFAVTLTATLAAGELPSMALPRAVRAAAAYVAEGAAWHADRTGGAPAGGDHCGGGDAVALARATREQGGTVVATGGCFDLLHRGHVALLEQARRLGDRLIVCLNDDASVTRLKGHPRPLVPARDRASVLKALRCVDAVLVFGEDTPTQALTRLRPHIYAKGGDYALGDLPERAAVEAGGGQVVLLPYLDGRSTTALIRRATLTARTAGPA
jgi:rfaE bifunctional protein nucleotidyltransferase chain/domain/rfaE bifunctional protein kinase chain/domain